MGLQRLYISFSTVISLLSAFANAYVTTSTIKHLSIPAMFGKSLKGRKVDANLFLPPRDLDFELCQMYKDDDQNNTRSLLADSSVLANDGLLTTDKPSGFVRKRLTRNMEVVHLVQNNPHKSERQTQAQESIVLLVMRGKCNFLQKALNAMKLNDLWSKEGGPRIEYMIIQNYDIPGRDSPLEMDAFDEKKKEVTLGIVSISYTSGYILTRDMAQVYISLFKESNTNYSRHINPESFMSLDNDDRNQWSFPVKIDGIYLYQDIAKRSQNITIVFLIIALSIPFIRGIMVFFMLNRDFRFRRNNRGYITGITWTRRSPPPAPSRARNSIVMNLWTTFQKNTITEEEVKNLPVVEYGITDLKQTIQDYTDKRDKDKMNESKDDKVGEKVDMDEMNEARDEKVDKESDHSLTKPSTQDDSNKSDIVAPRSFIDDAYTFSISCSVCLSDFEHGEEVKLLPMCGHLFHTDCIMPWLTEKKGSCPLCQTDVLIEDDNNENENDE